jgi:glycerol-3-phosphate acyltransferase PlsY
MKIIVLTLVGFFKGSIPFSLIFSKLFTKTDIRIVGDGGGCSIFWALSDCSPAL